MTELSLYRLDPRAIAPSRETPLSVSLDLYAFCLTENERRNTILIPPNTSRIIRTGWGIAPSGTLLSEMWLPVVCSRGALAAKSIFVANSPNIIDPDYRGELLVILYNGGHESHYIQHEDCVAQLTMLRAELPMIVVRDRPEE